MKTFSVKINFLEESLGTAPINKELYSEFIVAKRENGTDADEVETLPVAEEIQKGTTGFHRLEDGTPFVYDYQVKGYFKDACQLLRRSDDSLSKKLKAYKKEIDGLLFVKPRKIQLHLPSDAKIGICERPLRAQTMQGERITLARSETIPAGTWMEFEITILSDSLKPLIVEWLEYGKLRGFSQWRNSGKGIFDFEIKGS